MFDIKFANEEQRNWGWNFSPDLVFSIIDKYIEEFGDDNVPDIEIVNNLLYLLYKNNNLKINT